jgi:uncharacterized protein (TIGR00251 family)
VRTRRPWSVTAGGISLDVRLTPKSSRDAIEGIGELSDGRAVLKARVCALPSEGDANAALARLLAKTLGVALRDVTLVGGQTARVKRFKIAGDGPALAVALEKIAAAR